MTDADQSANAVTLASYEAGAERYAAAEAQATAATLQPFWAAVAARLPAGAQVLEIGSATGRDADGLEALGLRVVRSDASRAFVATLRARGHAAQELNVLHDPLGGPWAGIYANAVFLHLSPAELAAVLKRTAAAVTPGGLLAFTVKEGDGSGWSHAKLGHPRHFTYWRATPLRAALAASPWQLESLEHVPGRTEPWLRCLCTRPAPPVSAGR